MQTIVTVRTLASHLAGIHPANIRAGVSVLRTLDGEADGIGAKIDQDCQSILDTLAEPHGSFTAGLYQYAALLHAVHDGIFGIQEEEGSSPDLTASMNELERIAANLGIDVYFDSHAKGALLLSRASLDPIDRWLAGASSDHLDESYIRAKKEGIHKETHLDPTGGPPQSGQSNVVPITTGRRANWKDAAAAACTITAALAFGRFGALDWHSLASIALLVCIAAPAWYIVKRHAPDMLTSRV